MRSGAAGLVLAAIPLAVIPLTGCGSTDVFRPTSTYPPDPWVKGYSDPDDCLGGEQLAAIDFDLPDYPKRAFRAGQQGWVILRLDVDAQGQTQNVEVERAVPEDGIWGGFETASVKAAQGWTFQPPAAPLADCRVLMRYRLGGVSLGG